MKFNILYCFLLYMTCLSCQPSTSSQYIKELEQHRVDYKEKFKNNERAPLRTDEELSLMDFYKANQSYDLKCNFKRDDKQTPVVMSTYSGKKKDFIIYGTAGCQVNDSEFSLLIYQSAMARSNPLAAKHLFLPFKDFTNGEETYGGGRYMDVSIDDVEGSLINLDFNHSYNPWCAYSDGYNCPIPPVENHLQFEMKVGEKNYLGEIKH